MSTPGLRIIAPLHLFPIDSNNKWLLSMYLLLYSCLGSRSILVKRGGGHVYRTSSCWRSCWRKGSSSTEDSKRLPERFRKYSSHRRTELQLMVARLGRGEAGW